MKNLTQLQDEFIELSADRTLQLGIIAANEIEISQLKFQAEIDVHLGAEYAGLKNDAQRTAQVKSLLIAGGFFDKEAKVALAKREVSMLDAQIRVCAWSIDSLIKGGANY